MKRIFIFLLIYEFLLLLAYTYREEILTWLHDENYSEQLPWMFLISLLINIIPIIPFSIFSGIMGMKYGIWLGALINWLGSVGAAILLFFLARYFLVELFQTSLLKYKQAQKVEQIFSKNAFFAVLFCRMVPLTPSQIINISSGLSSMIFSHYFLATIIGQLPTMFIYAYLGKQLSVSFTNFLFVMIVYIVCLLLLFSISIRFYKKA